MRGLLGIREVFIWEVRGLIRFSSLILGKFRAFDYQMHQVFGKIWKICDIGLWIYCERLAEL
ncbi:hypothetical protein NS258_14145 [Sphingomonas sanguinis]|uniref:Uncharacterized protein n=1 Tax=Sphingomonas sanguinis TaxID=33051 RepID=A0A147J6J3_9SPHN|nr:hypothetical protein NS258_14145 [Sphingomonas sanguinis]